MDMDKLLALHSEEERDEQRFKETMTHRDRILKKKGEIENVEKLIRKTQQEITVAEPKICQLQMDVKMLDTQIKQITDDIRDKLENVLKDEDKLKKSKETFQSLLRDRVEKNKDLLHQYQIEGDADATAIQLKEAEKTAAARRRVWALQGETEALEIIREYQTTKNKEINYIISAVGCPFVAELKQHDSENKASSVFAKNMHFYKADKC